MQRKNPTILVLCITVLLLGCSLIIVGKRIGDIGQERDRLRIEVKKISDDTQERARLLVEAREIHDLVLDNQAPASHAMTMLGLKTMLQQIYDQYREIGGLRKEVKDLRRQLEDGPPSALDDIENVPGFGGGSGFF